MIYRHRDSVVCAKLGSANTALLQAFFMSPALKAVHPNVAVLYIKLQSIKDLQFDV